MLSWNQSGHFLAQANLVNNAGSGATSAAAETVSATAGQAAPPPMAGGGFEQLILIVGFIAIFYFLLIRPQQKRAKKHKEFVASIKRGDQVITSGGMYGRVVELGDTTVEIEIAKNVRVKVLRSYIATRKQDDDAKDLEAVRQAT